MVNSPFIRPAISWGVSTWQWGGSGPLGSHDYKFIAQLSTLSPSVGTLIATTKKKVA